MKQLTTKSVIATKSKPTKEQLELYPSSQEFNIDIDVLIDAFSKVNYPINLYLDYGNEIVGHITGFFVDEFNNLESIGVEGVFYNETFKYVSISYLTESPHNNVSADTKSSIRVLNFSAFNECGYDDVSEVEVF